ncbi:MAG: magnesium transporter [Pseudomonadales bacterium]|nr:magnesium transporter [Pseudomonadales bacterium]
MAKKQKVEKNQARLLELNHALESGTFAPIRAMLNGLPAVDVARLLESSPPKLRSALWQLIEHSHEGDILQYLSDDLQAYYLNRMNPTKVAAITEGLDTDDIADILQQLPDTVIHQVLRAMDSQDRHRVERVLSYPEDTAGRLMDTNTITVRPRFTLDVVLRYLRRHEELPDMTDNIIVVNSRDEFVGLLPLSKILVSDPTVTVRETMQTDIEPILATMTEQEVSNLFERHDWVSAPVVDEKGILVGRITIDDVVDVILEDASHSILSMAGLDEDEDAFAPVKITATNRLPWLGANLITNILAAGVISLFTDAIEQVVALAVLMPIVASMGGVAGSQTLTLVIRGIALGQIGTANVRWLLRRELLVGMINGIVWAAALGAFAVFCFDDVALGWIIAVAMILNMIAAPLVGAFLPLFLKKVNIDPALAGTVLLTTITDVVGFVAFLGLASLVYL